MRKSLSLVVYGWQPVGGLRAHEHVGGVEVYQVTARTRSRITTTGWKHHDHGFQDREDALQHHDHGMEKHRVDVFREHEDVEGLA